LLKDITQAKFNYARSWKQVSIFVHFDWMSEWSSMCQENPDPGVAERLEMIALTDPEAHAAFFCRSVAMWLRQSGSHRLPAWLVYQDTGRRGQAMVMGGAD
jgi:hypothetical protein